MSRPVVGSIGEELYEAVTPLAYDDEANDWALLKLCGAAGAMVQDVADIVLEDETTEAPGWSSILDVERCPDFALPFLSYFVGVQLATGADADTWRQQIRDKVGFQRGTLGALRSAVTATLTGDAYLQVRERYNPNDPLVDSPYHLTIITLTAETTDAAATEAAARTQKPIGIVLHHIVVDGQTWQDVIDNNATWQDVIDTYATWQDLIDDNPI